MGKEQEMLHEPREPHSKIYTLEQTASIISRIQAQGGIVELALGVFDLLHLGHMEYLRLARANAQLLVVGVEMDETVRRNKGLVRPYYSQQDRMYSLSQLEAVDIVFGFEDIVEYQTSIEEYIARYRFLHPNFLAVSHNDPFMSQKVIQAEAAETKLHIITHDRTESTTEFIEKLRGEI